MFPLSHVNLCHENKSQPYINSFIQVCYFQFLLVDLWKSLLLKNVIKAKHSLPGYQNLLQWLRLGGWTIILLH